MAHRPSLSAALLVGTRRPRLTLTLTFLITALAVAAMTRLRTDASVSSLFGPSDPAAAALSAILDRFGPAEDLLVLAAFPAQTGPESADERARELRGFADRLNGRLSPSLSVDPRARALVRSVSWAPPAGLRDYITALVPAGACFLSDNDVNTLLHRLTPAEMSAQLAQDVSMLAVPGPGAGALAKALLQDPLRLREFLAARLTALGPRPATYGGADDFISTDARAILIHVAGARPPSDLDFSRRLTDFVRDATAACEPGPLRVELAGSYAIATLSERAVRADAVSSITWTIILTGILFLVMYRSPLAFPLTMTPVAVGILAAFGVHAIARPALTPLTAVIGAMLAGLGSDYAVHLLSHIEHDRAARGDAAGAAERSIHDLAMPLFMACVTSIAGFIALFVSEIPALRDFALLGCLGLLLVLGASLTSLPAALLLLPSRVAGLSLVGSRFSFEPLARLAWKHGRGCIVTTVCLGAAAAAVLALAPGRFDWLEEDLRVMHPEPNPALAAQERIGAIFGVSPGVLFVHYRADSPESLVARAHEIGRALGGAAARQAGVAGVLGLDALVPDPARVQRVRERLATVDAEQVARDFRAALENSAFDPSRPEFVNYTAFLRRLLDPTQQPPTLDTLRAHPDIAPMFLARQTPATGPEGLSTILFSHDLDRRESRATAVETLRDLVGPIPDVTLTGLPVLGYDAERVIRRDLPRVLVAGFVVVVILLWAYLRRASDVALALLPFLFGVLCVLAWMRLTRVPFNMVNQMSLPILGGIGVDFGIFLVALGRTARADGASPDAFVARMGASLHAIFMATAPNVLAIGSLGTTSVPAIQSLGNTLTVGMIGAWVCSQFLLAPLAMRGVLGAGRNAEALRPPPPEPATTLPSVKEPAP